MSNEMRQEAKTRRMCSRSHEVPNWKAWNHRLPVVADKPI